MFLFFAGNILCLVLNIIFSHFLLYLQVMDPIGNKPSGFMGYPKAVMHCS